jgi:hypothetical protein
MPRLGWSGQIGRPSAWGPVWAVLLTTDAKTEGKEKADGEEAGKERGSSGSETAPPK